LRRKITCNLPHLLHSRLSQAVSSENFQDLSLTTHDYHKHLRMAYALFLRSIPHHASSTSCTVRRTACLVLVKLVYLNMKRKYSMRLNFRYMHVETRGLGLLTVSSQTRRNMASLLSETYENHTCEFHIRSAVTQIKKSACRIAP
jgi:hypothetical protein